MTRVGPGRSTIVSAAHGSFLTCHRRLGCASADHASLRRQYESVIHRQARRAAGVTAMRRGRTHGTRSTYRVCTDGPGGARCDDCKEAERSYKAAYRARAS